MEFPRREKDASPRRGLRSCARGMVAEGVPSNMAEDHSFVTFCFPAGTKKPGRPTGPLATATGEISVSLSTEKSRNVQVIRVIHQQIFRQVLLLQRRVVPEIRRSIEVIESLYFRGHLMNCRFR